MAIRHGVLEAASDTHDWVVICTVVTAVLAAFLLSTFFNYTYDWKFSSTAIVLGGVFATLGIVFLSFIDKEWKFNPQNNGISAVDIYGSFLLLLAAIIIAAIALAFSTRFNVAVTLAGCIGIFLLGLISDYVFGRFAQAHLWAKIGRFLVPNLQIFWISDAIYEGSAVPLKYVIISGTYALCYTAAILALAVALFQRRQVG
jgi:hypothetical protein